MACSAPTDLAFRRLNLASFYFFLLGAAIVIIGLVAGGADTGWIFCPPYSGQSPAALTPSAPRAAPLSIRSLA